jgi:hypothetical protein
MARIVGGSLGRVEVPWEGGRVWEAAGTVSGVHSTCRATIMLYFLLKSEGKQTKLVMHKRSCIVGLYLCKNVPKNSIQRNRKCLSVVMHWAEGRSGE